MPNEDPASTKELFLEALDLEGAALTEFLAALDRRAPETARRVGRLLAAHDGRTAASLDEVGGRVTNLLHDRGGVAGSTLADYELLEELASGSAGVVWRARQRSLGRIVALKVLRAGRLAGEREVERFRAEAEAVARLAHPCIVPVYEVGEHEGRHFFSMRLFEGGSLADRIAEGAPWDATAAAELVATVAGAVHHAHQRGLLHRDLKPSNVLLDTDGTPCVADFGVAKPIDEGGVAAVTATIAGTPAYMAPEQTAPDLGELTVATDVWALGCILYELLAGRPPFAGETLTELVARVRAADPTPLRRLQPGTPRDLETIVFRALAKEPERRYASANALATDLRRWLDHEPILARRTGALERLGLAWRRNPLVASLGVIVLLLVVALAIGGSWASVRLGGQLRDSLRDQARATRLSGVPGRRARALALLARAAEIRSGPDLRDEAAACLALTDLSRTIARPRRPGELDMPVWFAPDLERVAVREAADTLVVRSLADGELVKRLADVPGASGAHFSPDGRRLFVRYHPGGTPGRDAAIVVWDLERDRRLVDEPFDASFASFDFDPAGRHLAAVSLTGELVAWDLETGARLLEVALPARSGCVRFDGAGTRLAVCVGGGVNTLELRSFPGGDLLHEQSLPTSPFHLAWTARDREIVVAGADHLVYVLDPRGDEPRLALAGHDAEVVYVETSPTAPLAFTNSWDGTMRLWDSDTGEELLRVSARGKGFSSDGALLGFTTEREIGVWSVEHGGVLRTLHGHTGKSPRRVELSPDARTLITSGGDGALLWDVERGFLLADLYRGKCDGARFEPDGETFLLSHDGGLERRRLSAPTETVEWILTGDLDEIDLSSDGRLLAARDDGELVLLDPTAPARPADTRRFPAQPGFDSVEMSAGGTWITGSTWSGRGLYLWRGPTGERAGLLRPDDGLAGASISPDEELLVVGDGLSCEFLSLPGLESVGRIERAEGLRGNVRAMNFDHAGERFAFSLDDARTQILDARTREPQLTLEAPITHAIDHVVFSRDGRLLVTASTSNVIRIWDLGALEAALAARGL